jgi:hypothetical protein
VRTTIFLPSSAAKNPVVLTTKTSENDRRQIGILGGILFAFLALGGS